MSTLVLDTIAVLATAILVALLALRAVGVLGHRPAHRPSAAIDRSVSHPSGGRRCGCLRWSESPAPTEEQRMMQLDGPRVDVAARNPAVVAVVDAERPSIVTLGRALAAAQALDAELDVVVLVSRPGWSSSAASAGGIRRSRAAAGPDRGCPDRRPVCGTPVRHTRSAVR